MVGSCTVRERLVRLLCDFKSEANADGGEIRKATAGWVRR